MYKELSMEVHPDKNKEDEERARAVFQLVEEAKEKATDPSEMDVDLVTIRSFHILHFFFCQIAAFDFYKL